jgi:hypothetical protein
MSVMRHRHDRRALDSQNIPVSEERIREFYDEQQANV